MHFHSAYAVFRCFKISLQLCSPNFVYASAPKMLIASLLQLHRSFKKQTSFQRTIPGCPAKWLHSEILYGILVLYPGIRRHQGALSMTDGPGNVLSPGTFIPSRKFVSKWNHHETTLSLMWDDLIFHLHISCSFWSLLGYVFVSMLKMQPLGKSRGIYLKLNSESFDLYLTEEEQRPLPECLLTFLKDSWHYKKAFEKTFLLLKSTH